MAYGDYSGPDKADKGLEGGACNRQRCQARPASYYNHGSHRWYCADCARSISTDTVNARCWPQDHARMFPGVPLHPMFETRAEMRFRAVRGALEPFLECAERLGPDDPPNDRVALASVGEYRALLTAFRDSGL